MSMNLKVDGLTVNHYHKLISPLKKGRCWWIKQARGWLNTLFWRTVFIFKTYHWETDKSLLHRLARGKDDVKVENCEEIQKLFDELVLRIPGEDRERSKITHRLQHLKEVKESISDHKKKLKDVTKQFKQFKLKEASSWSEKEWETLIQWVAQIPLRLSYIYAIERERNTIDSKVINIQQELRSQLIELKKALAGFEVEEIKYIVDKLLTHRLPKRLFEPETNMRHSTDLNVFKRFYRTFVGSTSVKDIDWKVYKYEAQILQLPTIDSEINQHDPNRITVGYLKKLRNMYKQFIKTLHIKGDESECERLFTCVNLEPVSLDILEKFNKIGAKIVGKKKVSDLPIADKLLHYYKCIWAVPYRTKSPLLKQNINRGRGWLNKGFDPFSQGNPVHVLHQLLIGKKPVKALGFGTPTREVNGKKAELHGAFLGFLRSYKKQGKKHLFILNQNLKPRSLIGDETDRSTRILNLQHSDEFKGTYYAIALSKNSNFYKQKGKYRFRSNAEDFKKELMNQLFDLPREKSGNYIPFPELKEKVQKIVDEIHQTLFKDKDTLLIAKETLEKKERKIFIEKVYDALTLLLITELDVDSFNITCKDAIDRGAASTAGLYAHLLIVNNLQDEEEHQKRLAILLMVRALLVRDRAPIKERVDRFIECLRFALDNKSSVIALHQKIFPNTTITPSGPVDNQM